MRKELKLSLLHYTRVLLIMVFIIYYITPWIIFIFLFNYPEKHYYEYEQSPCLQKLWDFDWARYLKHKMTIPCIIIMIILHLMNRFLERKTHWSIFTILWILTASTLWYLVCLILQFMGAFDFSSN